MKKIKLRFKTNLLGLLPKQKHLATVIALGLCKVTKQKLHALLDKYPMPRTPVQRATISRASNRYKEACRSWHYIHNIYGPEDSPWALD